jgi:aspartyl-tRNA(Asn)/glutamyl-tRNA(Gln) amidotransferase subunit A
LDHSVVELARQVTEGATSAVQLTARALESAEQSADLNAFLHLSREAALSAAEAVDERRRRGERLGPLAGVPIAIKDALCVLDTPTAAASKILTTDGKHQSAWRPAYDASAVARLRAADAILIGKTNMDEFAMGSSNENSAFGPVKNPWDKRRIPGGSSGGSAAVVAAGSAPAALGSDTGGSIRQPASHCGVVGFKPSYGRVSRYGLIAFASSLDQVGPMTRCVRGSARVLSVIAGPDEKDATCAALPVGDYEGACGREIRGLRIGLPAEYFAEGLDDEVRQIVTNCVDRLREAGAQIVSVQLPHTAYGISTYYLVATAEASSNLSRFDGLRFGMQVRGADLTATYEKTRGAGFGAEVKRRIMLGTYALSSGYYDAYYKKAQRVRTRIREDFTSAFERVDVLLTPVSPTAAFRLGEKVADPLKMYLADVYSVPPSLAGICGVSVPAGMTAQTGDAAPLPVGVQFLAPAFEEERLFTVAAAWEELSPVRGRRPSEASDKPGP